MTRDRRQLHRRNVLGTVGIGALVSVAGCLGDNERDDDPDGDTDDTAETDDDADTGDEDVDDEDVEDDLAEPVEFPADPDEGECAACQMHAADYPDWNAQLVHADGHREYFCSKGCLAVYYDAPEKFTSGDPDAEIDGVWATCFNSGELIDATAGYFVYEQDRDRHDYPMPRGSPLAFPARDAAVEYVDDHDDLTEDEHVFTLADIDRDIAEFYRGPLLEAEA